MNMQICHFMGINFSVIISIHEQMFLADSW